MKILGKEEENFALKIGKMIFQENVAEEKNPKSKVDIHDDPCLLCLLPSVQLEECSLTLVPSF